MRPSLDSLIVTGCPTLSTRGLSGEVTRWPAVLELPGQTGSQVAHMNFEPQLSTVSCGEALQGPLRELTATLLLVLCCPHGQAVDSHPCICLLLSRNHTSRWNWLLNPKVLALPLLLVGSERRPFSRALQSTDCLEPGLLTQP